ncbi:hypothetical protein ACNQ1T_02525 [Mycoplasma sp. 1932B]|uniref:hypothetical protein n=1 Tax=Mycoplasma sp. 1932B TaxID=3401670 RepID=UPI003AAFBFDC
MKKKTKLILKAMPILPLPFLSLSILAASPTGSVSVSNTEIWKDNNSAYVYFGTQWAGTEYPKYYGKYQANQWMKDVNENKTLFQMSLPGTHDSGAWQGNGLAWNLGWRWGRTQSMNYTQQMNAGIRAFDVRADSDLNIRHGATYLDSNFSRVLNDIVSFLDKNPSEFIFLRVKDESMNVNNGWEAQKAAQNYLAALSQPKIYEKLFNPTGLDYSNLSTDDFKLKNLRGKIIIANFWHNKVQSKMFDVQNNYKANTWSGGFNYWQAIQRSTMQDNYDVSDSQKYSDAVKFMPLANGNSYDSRMLYLNFFSVANGYPYNSASNLNPKFNEVLSKNEQYTKLGIVYMDYPGPAIIENVFKRNYFITDEQLKHNYISTWNTKFTASNPLVNDNHLTIQGQNLAGYTIEIKQGDKIVASFTVPEGTTNQYTAELNSNLYFPLNANYTINAYRLTPGNAFYQSRQYNQFSYNVNVINTPHNQNIEALKTQLNEWKDKITQAYAPSNLQAYLNTVYFDVLKNILRPNHDNETKLTDLKNKFIQDSNNMDNLIKELEESFSTNTSLLDKHNATLSLVLNPSTIQALKDNLQTTFKEQLNSNISNSTINFNNVKQYIQNYLNMNNYLALDADLYAASDRLMDQIKSHFPYQNLGIETWQNQLTSYKTNLSELNSNFNQSYNIATGVKKFADLKIQLSSYSNQLDQLSEFISHLNDLITQYKLTEPEVLLFSTQIKAGIENLTNIQEIDGNFKEYRNLLDKAQNLVSQNDQFKIDYKFNEFMTTIRELYLTNVGQLASELSAQATKPITLDRLQSQINQIEPLKQKIINLYQNEKLIYDLPNLFKWQKLGYIKMIANLNGSDVQTKLELLLGKIKQINELNPLQVIQEEFLAPLNSEVRKLLNFDQTIDLDPDTFLAKFNNILELRKATIELKQSKNSLNNLSSALANSNILTTENSQELFKTLQNANSTLTNSATLEKYTEALDSINQINALVTTNYKEAINKLSAKITSSNKLFTYQKNLLNTQIDNSALTISNINNYVQAFKEFTQFEQDNLPEQKLASLTALSSTQKQSQLVFLNKEQSLDSFNITMQKANEFNNFLELIKASFQKLNYQQEDYYIHATQEQQEQVNSLATEFNSLADSSLESDKIQAKYDELVDSLNNLKRDYLAAKTNTNELINQLKIAIQQIEKFNVPEFNSYKANYLQQAHKYLELLQDSSKTFNDKVSIIALISKIDHLLQVAPSWKNTYDQINVLIAKGQNQFKQIAYAVVLKEFNKVVSEIKNSDIYQASDLEKLQTNSLLLLLTKITQAFQQGLQQCAEIDLNNKKQELTNELSSALEAILPNAKQQILNHLKTEINQIHQKINQLKNIQNANEIKQAINALSSNITSDNSYVNSYNTLENKLKQAKNSAENEYNSPAYSGMLDAYQASLDKISQQLNFNFNLNSLNQVQAEFTKFQTDAVSEREKALEQYNLAKQSYNQALKTLSDYANTLTNPLFDNLVAKIKQFIAQHHLDEIFDTSQIKQLTSQIQDALVSFQNQNKEIIKQILDGLKKQLSIVTKQINQIELPQLKMLKEDLLQQSDVISANLNPLNFTLEQKALLEGQIEQLQATIQQVNNIQPEYKTLLSTMQQYQAKATEFNKPENLKIIGSSYLNKLKNISTLAIFNPRKLSQVTKAAILDTINQIKQAYGSALEEKKALEAKQVQLSQELKSLFAMQNGITAIVDHNKVNFDKIQNQINGLNTLSYANTIKNEIQTLKESVASQLVYDKAYNAARINLEEFLNKSSEFTLPIEKEIKDNYKNQIHDLENQIQYNFDNNELNIILSKAKVAFETLKTEASLLIKKYQNSQIQINKLANAFKQLLKDNETQLSNDSEKVTNFIAQETTKANSNNLTFDSLENIYSELENYYNQVKNSLKKDVDNTKPAPMPNPSDEPKPKPKPTVTENNPDTPLNPVPEVHNQSANSHAALGWLALLSIPIIGIPLFIKLRKKYKK